MNHHPFPSNHLANVYASPLVIPTSNSRPASPVGAGAAYEQDHHRHKRPGDGDGMYREQQGKRMRMDEGYASAARHPTQGGTAAMETEDIIAGIRGALASTSSTSASSGNGPHGYQPHAAGGGFVAPVGFGRQGMSQTPVREGSGSGEEGEESEDDEDGRGKEERKRPKMTRGSR